MDWTRLTRIQRVQYKQTDDSPFMQAIRNIDEIHASAPIPHHQSDVVTNAYPHPLYSHWRLYCTNLASVLVCRRGKASMYRNGARWLLGVRTAVDIPERRHTSPGELLLVEGGLSDLVQDKLRRACFIKDV
jgi:hypothetical protein